MLVELSIMRIALIENLHLKLNRGLNTFTGETGAGKSILLDAIGLLLGNRASSDLIRHGEENGIVEAMFQVDGIALEQVRTCLASFGHDLDGDQILLSRELHRSNRTLCRINGRMASVQMLRELGEMLVQQHGQHEHQGLLKNEEQLRLLDLYAHHDELIAQVKVAYDAWKEAQKQLLTVQMDEQERMRRIDMLSFQIEEITSASLKAGEEEQLREERGRLQYADRIGAAVQSALDILSGNDRGRGVIDLIASAQSEFAAALKYDESLDSPRTFMETAAVHVDEAARSLAKYLRDLEQDPTRLDFIENRLAELRGLQRKYGATVDDILNYVEKSSLELHDLQNHEEQVSQLELRVAGLLRELRVRSEKLHESRRKFGEQLAKQVEAVLHALNMPRAVFQVDVRIKETTSGEPNFGPSGYDSVTFLFSANKGESVKPLQKIASGGELSRTLLAIKSVLAQVDGIDTLIFDEIDTGVSGESTTKIAEQLRKLGQSRQVLCVTHSAQIAAAASSHFRIYKQERSQDTATHVDLLGRTERIAEIARLVGAVESDETAVLHAEALLDSFNLGREVSG